MVRFISSGAAAWMQSTNFVESVSSQYFLNAHATHASLCIKPEQRIDSRNNPNFFFSYKNKAYNAILYCIHRSQNPSNLSPRSPSLGPFTRKNKTAVTPKLAAAFLLKSGDFLDKVLRVID